jgi:hypothetical protein
MKDHLKKNFNINIVISVVKKIRNHRMYQETIVTSFQILKSLRKEDNNIHLIRQIFYFNPKNKRKKVLHN